MITRTIRTIRTLRPASFTTGRGLASTTLVLALAAALQACGSAPTVNPALEQARTRLEAARSQTEVASLAAPELGRAREALDQADRARNDGASTATVDHLAYMARQHVVIAEETARSRAAQAVTAGAAAERDAMRLAQRTQQADQAERKLGAAELANARQGEQLASAERATRRTAAELAASERDNALKSSELAQSEAAARAERSRVMERDARVNDLELQLKDLNARKTERGIVVTLGDLLFNSGQSQLQSEGLRSVGKLADFLKRNPSRMAVIEGYTDSQGSDDFNQGLSDRRAHAVMDALVQQGIGAPRLSTQAFGEGRPVADNTTAGGRQMNRRVEVVFAPEAGDVLLK